MDLEHEPSKLVVVGSSPTGRTISLSKGDYMILQYIRNRNNQPIGIMVADIIDGTMRIGISRCNKKDRFNKNRGMAIATGRLNCEDHHNFIDEDTPSEISVQIDNFNNRARRYFKPKQGE